MKVPYAQQVQSYIVANENVDGGCNQHENDNVRFVHLLCGSKVSNKLEYCIVLCVCLQNLRVLLANANRQALLTWAPVVAEVHPQRWKRSLHRCERNSA
jgi:hypothetical protein